MNSSVRRSGRLLRTTTEPGEVFVLGETSRAAIPTHGALATVEEVLSAANARATAIIAAAEQRAAEIERAAQSSFDDVRNLAYGEGFQQGMTAAMEEAERCLAVVREAAAAGKAVRDGLAEQSATVVARAAMLALRRITADYYEADPERTALICEEAIRAASGQEILTLRVNPAVAGAVQATLVDAARYVRPDEAVAVGGCVIDLRNGTLDATLDARLDLMELALARSSGDGVQ